MKETVLMHAHMTSNQSGAEKDNIVKELFPEKALVKEFAQPTVQKRFHSGLL